jgi:hypothetical protein
MRIAPWRTDALLDYNISLSTLKKFMNTEGEVALPLVGKVAFRCFTPRKGSGWQVMYWEYVSEGPGFNKTRFIVWNPADEET